MRKAFQEFVFAMNSASCHRQLFSFYFGHAQCVVKLLFIIFFFFFFDEAKNSKIFEEEKQAKCVREDVSNRLEVIEFLMFLYLKSIDDQRAILLRSNLYIFFSGGFHTAVEINRMIE